MIVCFGLMGLEQDAFPLTVEVAVTFRRMHNMYSNYSNFKIMIFKLEIDLLIWS